MGITFRREATLGIERPDPLTRFCSELTGSGSLILLGWSMSRTDPSEASGLGFDHGAEVVPAPGALLLQVLADRGEVLIGYSFVEQVPPAANAG